MDDTSKVTMELKLKQVPFWLMPDAIRVLGDT